MAAFGCLFTEKGAKRKTAKTSRFANAGFLPTRGNHRNSRIPESSEISKSWKFQNSGIFGNLKVSGKRPQSDRKAAGVRSPRSPQRRRPPSSPTVASSSSSFGGRVPWPARRRPWDSGPAPPGRKWGRTGHVRGGLGDGRDMIRGRREQQTHSTGIQQA